MLLSQRLSFVYSSRSNREICTITEYLKRPTQTRIGHNSQLIDNYGAPGVTRTPGTRFRNYLPRDKLLFFIKSISRQYTKTDVNCWEYSTESVQKEVENSTFYCSYTVWNIQNDEFTRRETVGVFWFNSTSNTEISTSPIILHSWSTENSTTFREKLAKSIDATRRHYYIPMRKIWSCQKWNFFANMG